MSVWSVAYKNDESACLWFLIMSPDPYFYFIFVSSHNSGTIRTILMILGRIIEQAGTVCCIHE